MRVVLGLSLFLSSIVFVGCGSSGTSSGGFDDGSSGGSSSGGSSSGASGSSSGFGGSSGSSGSSGASSDGCSDAAKLVYVVADNDLLYSFAPDTLTFKLIGALQCESFSSPNSMAIDRSGTAWVNYSDGSLFKVSTKDASCESTKFQPGQSGFFKFGMAFSTNGANTKEETLYVVGIEANDAGKGLAKIDLSTMKLTTIGDFSGTLARKGAELTGTGDGRLYGFFTTKPNATLAQIDPATGATSANVDLKGVNTGTAWAFSFWGGDFWFYTSSTQTSTVDQYRTASKQITNVKPDVGGFRIVGAGVSTCAPTGPVR